MKRQAAYTDLYRDLSIPKAVKEYGKTLTKILDEDVDGPYSAKFNQVKSILAKLKPSEEAERKKYSEIKAILAYLDVHSDCFWDENLRRNIPAPKDGYCQKHYSELWTSVATTTQGRRWLFEQGFKPPKGMKFGKIERGSHAAADQKVELIPAMGVGSYLGLALGGWMIYVLVQKFRKG